MEESALKCEKGTEADETVWTLLTEYELLYKALNLFHYTHIDFLSMILEFPLLGPCIEAILGWIPGITKAVGGPFTQDRKRKDLKQAAIEKDLHCENLEWLHFHKWWWLQIKMDTW